MIAPRNTWKGATTNAPNQIRIGMMIWLLMLVAIQQLMLLLHSRPSARSRNGGATVATTVRGGDGGNRWRNRKGAVIDFAVWAEVEH